jgi:hypothetical protein
MIIMFIIVINLILFLLLFFITVSTLVLSLPVVVLRLLLGLSAHNVRRIEESWSGRTGYGSRLFIAQSQPDALFLRDR